MGGEFLNRIPIECEFLFREEHMDLRVAGAADAGGLAHKAAFEFPLVPFVAVLGSWDAMMARGGIDAHSNRTGALHEVPANNRPTVCREG
jgi:hypothetical protein